MYFVFADSFYFFALLNPQDSAHDQAANFSRDFGGVIVSTSSVFLEVGDGLCAVGSRHKFIRLFEVFRTNRRCRLICHSAETFNQGIDLYGRRMDKAWSLTDCLSFVVMANERITDALTADHHFTEAGFKTLL